MNTTLKPLIDKVLSLQSFVPSNEVNRVMGSLVDGVIDTTSKDVTQMATDQQILKVRQISAQTESELEKFWARLVINSNDPLKTLKSFPYLSNYEELTKREVKLIEQSGLSLSSDHKALIIGSGPLPLSAYELHLQTGVRIDHVDSCREAIQLCKQLMERIGMSSRYYEAPGEAVELRDTYDLILIAALAGSTAKEKQKIINTVMPHLGENGRIVIRSAKGTRTLLYPGVESGEIQGVRLVKEYHPTDYIINSVFVYGR